MAGGASGVRIPASGPERERFAAALGEVCRRLAELIVRDGEGATKLVEVAVTGARSDADALRVADAVANSKLVKTAWFGRDLNWGRIVAAIGYAGARVDPERVVDRPQRAGGRRRGQGGRAGADGAGGEGDGAAGAALRDRPRARGRRRHAS